MSERGDRMETTDVTDVTHPEGPDEEPTGSSEDRSPVSVRFDREARATEAEPEVVFDVRDLSVYYGDFRAVRNVTLPVYRRADLVPEHVLKGPVLVEDPWATTLVYPGQTGRLDRHGNVVIDLAR